MAEHMLILGICPNGDIKYITAAFLLPAVRQTFMLIPPEIYKQGYKVWTVGDDIAWLK